VPHHVGPGSRQNRAATGGCRGFKASLELSPVPRRRLRHQLFKVLRVGSRLTAQRVASRTCQPPFSSGKPRSIALAPDFCYRLEISTTKFLFLFSAIIPCFAFSVFDYWFHILSDSNQSKVAALAHAVCTRLSHPPRWSRPQQARASTVPHIVV
jgi:hypothetical protein